MSALELRGGSGGDTPLGRRHSPRTAQPLYRPPGRRRTADTSESAAADRRPPRQLYVPPRGRRHGLNRASSPGFSTCSEIVTSWRTAPDAGPARPPPGPRRRISQETRQHVERLSEAREDQEVVQNGRPSMESHQNGPNGSPLNGSLEESPGKRPGRRRRRGGRRSRSSSEDRSASASAAASASASASAAVVVSPAFQVPTFPLSPTATAPRPAHVPWRTNAASGRFTPTPERETARTPPSRPRFQQPYQPPAIRDRPASAAAELPSSPQRNRVAPDSPQRQGQRGQGSPQQRSYAPRDSPQHGSGQGYEAQNWRARGGYYSPPSGGRDVNFYRAEREDDWREQRGQAGARPALHLNLSGSVSSGGPAKSQLRSPPDCSQSSAVAPRRSSGTPRSPSGQPPTTPPSPRAAADAVGSDSLRPPLSAARREPAQLRTTLNVSPSVAAAAAAVAPVAPGASDRPGAHPLTSGGSRSERATVGGTGVDATLPAGRYDHLVNSTDDEKVSLSARIGRSATEGKATLAAGLPGLDTQAEGSLTGRQSSTKDEDIVSPVPKERADICESSELSNGQCDSSSGVGTDAEDTTATESDDARASIVQTACTNVTYVTGTSSSSHTSPTENGPGLSSASEPPPWQDGTNSESASEPPPRQDGTISESASEPPPRQDGTISESAAAASPLPSDSVEAGEPSAPRRHSSASSARSSSVVYERFDWAEEMEEWEKNYTDEGEPTAAKVAPPAPSRPVIDYLSWRPPSPPSPQSPPAGDDADTSELDLPAHVLEVYDFPSSFTTQDLTVVFQEFGARGFDVRWVDDTHALAVFSSTACVAEALLKQHPLVRCRPLCQASPRARQKAAHCQQAEALLPHRPRPETCALQARRMVFTALGRRDSAPREQREQEKRQLQTARDKKRLAAKQKQDAWEGNF